MRVAILTLTAMSWMLMAGDCLPIDLNANKNAAAPGHELAVAVLEPGTNKTVATGTTVVIDYTAANLTGTDAIATVLVRSRADRSETILAGGVRIGAESIHNSVDWNTDLFAAGRYNAVVRIEAGDKSDEDVSVGVITIDAPPEFEFTEPLTDATLADATPDDTDPSQSLTIRWSASDKENNGKVALKLDPDGDHASGNEISILERDIPDGGGFDSLTWNGENVGGDRVAEGTYHLFVTLSDGVNRERNVDSPALITVPAAPDTSTSTLKITEPSADVEYRPAADVLRGVVFTLPGTEDALIDLKADTDDSHQSGNEVTILSQQFEAKGKKEDSFGWAGRDTGGVDVPDGIYRIFIVQTLSAGNPTTAEAPGLVFLRREENKPLVATLSPSTDQTLVAGNFLTIRWRDDAPGADAATIRITLDDDANPAEISETNNAELELLTGRDAKVDGVQDSFSYQVPGSLAPGTYYIFVYIDRDGAAPWDNISKAAGRLIIKDPTTP